MLRAVLGPGFSKTARSHPGHREAGRHGKNEFAIAIRGRSVTNDFCERPAESTEASETNIETDIRDTAWSLPKQEHRPFHPPALQETMRSLAKSRPKGPDEMGFGDRSDPCEVRDVERLRIRAVDRVAGPQHPAIELLDGAGHDPIVSQPGTTPARGTIPRRQQK